MELTITAAKAAARVLREDMAESGIDITHSRALEVLAHQLGYRDWNTAAAEIGNRRDLGMGSPVPVLRIQDDSRAREFYLGYLGFVVEWEHRFEPGMPLYARLRRGQAVIDLSEHHGDGTPGSVIWVPVGNVAAFRRELDGKNYTRLRPGIDKKAPGGPTMDLIDPFSNTLRFCQVT